MKLIERRVEGEAVEGNVLELMYSFDKNVEENVYVSKFDGVEFDLTEENKGIIKKNEEVIAWVQEKVEEIEEERVDSNEKLGFFEEIPKLEENTEKIDRKTLNPELKNSSKSIFNVTPANQTVTQTLKVKKSNPKLIPEVKKKPSQISAQKPKNTEYRTLKDFQLFVKNLQKPEEASKKEPLSSETPKSPIIQDIISTPKPVNKVPAELEIIPAPNIKASPSTDSNPLLSFLPLKRTRNTDLYKPVLEIIPKKTTFK